MKKMENNKIRITLDEARKIERKPNKARIVADQRIVHASEEKRKNDR